MIINKLLAAFAALLIILSSASAQQRNYHFTQFSDVEKLTSSRITDFFQDSYGFLWLATPDGLNRYDGRNVKFYKNRQGDETSLPDNECHVLLEDNESNMWVGCFNLIGKLDRTTEKFKTYSLDHLPRKSFVRFFASMLDAEGNIWFANSQHSVLRYNKDEDTFEKVDLDSSSSNGVWGEVHDIIELKNGAIIAADYKNGLKKYNKERNIFEDFYLKPGFSPSKIQDIYEDSKGFIWFSGDNLLIKYSPSQYMVVEYDLIKYSRIKSRYNQLSEIVEDNEGNMWIGTRTHGLFKLDQGAEIPEQFLHDRLSASSILNNNAWRLFKDKYGTIWIGFQLGGINRLDTQIEPFVYSQLITSEIEQNSTNTVNQIVQSPSDRNELYLGTSTEGIYKFKLDSNDPKMKYERIYKAPGDSATVITGLTLDSKGNIWFTEGNDWLKKLEMNTGKITTFTYPNSGKTPAPFLNSSLDISQTGNIWISSNHGTDEFNPITGEVESVPIIMNKKVNPDLKSEVKEIAKDRNALASILAVGEGANLEKSFVLEKQQKILLVCVGEGQALGQMYDFGSIVSPAGDIPWAMDNVLYTYYSGGGYKNRIAFKCLDLAPGEYKIHFTSDIGHSYGNWNTLTTPDSSWWGIQAFALSDEEFSKVKNLNEEGIKNNKTLSYGEGRVLEFSKKYSNNVWIGSSANSFFRYNISTGNYVQYNYDSVNVSSATNTVFCIYEDLDGIVWVGTYSSLIRLEPESGQINIFTTEEGLPGGIIQSIIEDNNGALWINNSGGLSKLNKNAPLEKYAFINYDSRDGLKGQSQEPRQPVWKSESGRLYFGAKNGLISFMPGVINTVEPDVVIHNMKIKEVSIFDDSSDVSINSGILNADHIQLSYNQNDISFDFSSIHFSRPEKNKIAYKLEGYNNTWIDSDRDYASFTNLDPGEYIFKVKGANGDGIWNEEGNEIKITILPPWWYTTYAYIGYGLLLIGGIFGLDRFQRRRLLAKARERMKIQEAEHRAEAAELQSRAVQAENERKTKELEEARDLQLSMLPKELPQLPNLDIAVYMKTATEVGGDYYDFHVSMDGTLTVVMGDATGHGMKAGTMVTAVKGLFNSYANNNDILFTFHEMTRCIKQMHLDKLSMCMTMLKIHQNNMLMSAAGMPPMFIYRKDDRVIEEMVIKGMPLGTMEKFPYDVRETVLNPGDTILLLSDGFPELQNSDNEQFGYQRARNMFEEVADNSPEEIVTKLKDEGSRWVEDNDPDDDVTFVVIKVK